MASLILPLGGRWQPAGLTEGCRRWGGHPSTTPLRVAVPLPLWGRTELA
jgi:hypothetical protein